MIRHFVLYIVLGLFFLSCSSHKEGKVVKKYFTQAHNEEYWETSIQSCVMKRIPSSYNIVVIDETGTEFIFPLDKKEYDKYDINDVFKIY